MTDTDLWNLPIGTFIRKRGRPTEPRGYAATPGTGPEGETCKTCAHLYRRECAKTYLKCLLMKSRWTGGAATDIRAGSPACNRWERGEI